MAASDNRTTREPSAWRITFEYDRDTTRVLSQERVAMLAPPDDAALLRQGEAGYWVEIRDAANKVVYRQVLHEPIRTDEEVFPEDPSNPIRRAPVAHPQGVFEVVVPDLARGHTLVLHGRASPAELRERGPRQLVRARLREVPPPGPARDT
jgi:hypothetical protein